jgi:periplasmic protein CpxP/Spy
MNRKWMISCICALALACAGLQSMAQTNPSQTTPPAGQSAPSQTNPSAAQTQEGAGQTAADPELVAKVQARLQQISTELGLTDEQKSQLKPILQEEFARLKAVKDDRLRSIDDKKSKMKEIQDDARGKMKSVLSPEQKKKLDEMKGNEEDNQQ